MAAQVTLCLAWSETPEDTFSHDEAHMSIVVWHSVMLYTGQVLDVVKNPENDIFSLVSSYLMFIFSPNVGHKEIIISKS